jgi:ferric-dicitrate binding protein FerR (iron transport regulator)
LDRISRLCFKDEHMRSFPMGQTNEARSAYVFMLAAVLISFSMIWGPAFASEGTPEELEYLIEDIQGPHVEVLADGQSKWESAQEGQVLEAGDEIKVGEGSEATLMLRSEASVQLIGESSLKVERVEIAGPSGFFSRLRLSAGRLLADVKKNLKGSHSVFEIESNGVVCGVRGTVFEVSSQGEGVQTATHEGEVEVTGLGESRRVKAGHLSMFKARKFQMLRRLDRLESQRFHKWKDARGKILQKRLQRIEAIKNHKRKPWIRRHPRLKNKALKQGLRKQWINKNQQRAK